jgi:predicted flap endonuclease-1-like 5' DNA nuclease
MQYYCALHNNVIGGVNFNQGDAPVIVQLKPETEAAIRARAHQIWEEEGRPNGRHEIHWQRAYEAIADVSPLKLAAVTAAPKADDVSLIDGVGPKITQQLAAEGIVSLSQIAALTPAALAALDTKLSLKGRTAREEWIDQAKELLAGKAPRAKVDQAKVAAKKK